MTDAPSPTPPADVAPPTQSPTAGDAPRLDPATRLLLAIFGRLEIGRLTVRLPGGDEILLEGSRPGGHGILVLQSSAAVRRALLGGGTGFAEGYVDGTWDTPDLVALLDVLAANIALGLIETRLVPLQPLQRAAHLVRPNTHRGARRNIADHYDLGNDFYRSWLDPTMTYSAALFADEHPADCHRGTCPTPAGPLPQAAGLEELAEAQRAKWERLLDTLEVGPGAHILEIGCGWGGFACHAAESRGARVTGITISEEQLSWARAEAARRGLEDQVEFRLQDYRDVEESFDGVVSIEMFEAVGERYWPAFFRAVARALRPGAHAALQVITLEQTRFSIYRHTADFIQQYIFPGGMLPSPAAFRGAAAAEGLRSEPPTFFGLSYAKTLQTWLERFDRTNPEEFGLDERFRRMWRYYLAYCIAGFRNGLIDVMQVRLAPDGEASSAG